MRLLLAALLLSACSGMPQAVDKEPAVSTERAAASSPRKEDPRSSKPKPSPPAVQAPPPPPLPTVDHCSKIEAETPTATVRAKLDCLAGAAKK
jgi:hypothetical protein